MTNDDEMIAHVAYLAREADRIARIMGGRFVLSDKYAAAIRARISETKKDRDNG
jgi:hypothetical protein